MISGSTVLNTTENVRIYKTVTLPGILYGRETWVCHTEG
jgi:hypothetical protein